MSLIQRRINSQADGKYVIAHKYDGFYISKDYGLTWVKKDKTNFPQINFGIMSLNIAMTKNGRAYIPSGLRNSIYCLTNGLESLMEIPVNNINNRLNIDVVACNSNGDIIVIEVALMGTPEHVLAMSKDYGKTWSVLPGLKSELQITKIKVSSSGKYILVCGRLSSLYYIYVSSDGGNSFQKVTMETYSKAIGGIAMSANGNYMLYWTGGALYRSTDYGKTWNNKPTGLSRGNVTAFDLSNDGKYMVYTGEYMSYVWVSTDYGNKFKSISMSTEDIPQVVISGSGKYSVAVGFNNALQSSDFLESYLFKQELNDGRGKQLYSLTMSK